VATLYAPSSRTLFSLADTALGTTLTGPGSSNPGGWNATNQNARSSLDLRDVTDVWIAVTAGGASGGAPSLVVNLDLYDDLGNLFPAVASTTALTAAGQQAVAIGLHTGGTKAQALPAWGRISWTVGTGSFTGVQIAVFGR
jgi:hypothetical protein